jgi:hypothetical protein
MGSWYFAPLLAADPTGDGNVLVAALPSVSPPTVASFDTSADPVTVWAEDALPDCGGVTDVAVVPGGAGFILACVNPQEESAYLYSTSGLSEQRYYGTVGTPNAVAIASSTGLVAAGGAPASQIVDVYTTGGVDTNEYDAVRTGELENRGLGLNADGSELFAVTNDVTDYSLNIYPDPSITPTSVTITGPAKITVGNSATITGTVLVGGSAPDVASIPVIRTGGGQPALTFSPHLTSDTMGANSQEFW